MLSLRKKVSALSLHCGYICPWYMSRSYQMSGYRFYWYYVKPLHLIVRFLHGLRDKCIWLWGDAMWAILTKVLYIKEYKNHLRWLTCIEKDAEKRIKIAVMANPNFWYKYEGVRIKELTRMVVKDMRKRVNM